MFSGIVEGVGSVAAIDLSGAGGARLGLEMAGLHDGLTPGASVAVNGVCLTVVECLPPRCTFDVVPETLRRTNLGALRPGDRVNLERSLRLGDRIDGHFVQGHVEGVGTVRRVERGGGEWLVWTRAPAELLPCIVHKGSIAIDGTSLTVAEVRGDEFAVALIPTTLERTTLGRLAPGAAVNLETDIIARQVVRHLQRLAADGGDAGLRLEQFRTAGFR
ncbi:MAG: riboflavin synthase [Phycisphaerae bacterium]|nr:riboflavin synthase [Phycisphaerae bacterium]MCZ2398706.1 riboflavin synthase [Phycisphaerae bacterium]NUQ48942.1 riboflavin synthase [Phycisphaerae bacterium]